MTPESSLLAAAPAPLSVLSPGMSTVQFMCQPDMAIRLNAGVPPTAVLQPVHSHVLAAASPLLADWVAEFGHDEDMLQTIASPTYPMCSSAASPPASGHEGGMYGGDWCHSPGSAQSSSTSGSPPLAASGGPSRLVLPAEGDDAGAWAKVLALIYPRVVLPLPMWSGTVTGQHHGDVDACKSSLLPGGSYPALTSHDAALSTWEDVERVYTLGHKYDMQGVMAACRARLNAAVQATCDTLNPELWTPEAGRTFSDMQAAYQARLDRAAQGFCLNDPLSPVFILRWLAFAVHFHEPELEADLQSLCKANASTVFVHHGGAADSGARNAAFLHWWNTLGHAYCLKLTTPPTEVTGLRPPQVTAASSLTRTPSQAAAHAAGAKSPGDQAGEIYREGTTAWALLYGM